VGCNKILNFASLFCLFYTYKTTLLRDGFVTLYESATEKLSSPTFSSTPGGSSPLSFTNFLIAALSG